MKKFFVFFLSVLFFLTDTTITNAAVKIVVNKGTNQLAYYEDNTLTKVFPVATGRNPSYTPEGNFYIISKIINPPYYKKHIPGGCSYNPLGYRWLGLSAPGGPYGIHGTNAPSSIGTYASGGCIRLYNKDINWLYDHVSLNTPVEIIHNSTNFNQLIVTYSLVPCSLNQEVLPHEFNALLGDGYTLIPLRAFVEKLGGTVFLDAKTNQITVNYGTNTSNLTLKQNTITFNGSEEKLSHSVISYYDSTYITPQFIQKMFGCTYSWNTQTHSIDFVLFPSNSSEN